MRISDRKGALKPILESSQGVHLSVYLSNRRNVLNLKAQLRESIEEATDWLRSAMTNAEMKRFLEPLEALARDYNTLKSLNGNIGIFRTKDIFRLLVLPVDVERQCHVADSFHVKPLLRWMQADRQFLLMGLKRDSAHLFLGSLSSLQKIDSILFPEIFKLMDPTGDYSSLKKSKRASMQLEEIYSWLGDWLDQLTERSKPRLYLAGEKSLVTALLKNLDYVNVVKSPVAHTFDEHRLPEISLNIRRTLKAEVKRSLELALHEVKAADLTNQTNNNFYQIAKAAVSGRVKKLVVADGVNVFGKVDPATGGVAIHTEDLNHEDDDILDDLAQAVLASGGEVVVARKEDMPDGRPVIAILRPEDLEGISG